MTDYNYLKEEAIWTHKVRSISFVDQVVVNIMYEPVVQLKIESKAEPKLKPDTKSKANSEVKPQVKPKTKVKSKAKPKAELKTNSEAEAMVKEDGEILDQFDSTDTESPATA